MPRYECDQCGACCKGHLIVEAYALDVLREPHLAAADIGDWTRDMAYQTLMAELDQDGNRAAANGYRNMMIEAAVRQELGLAT
jgi:hypothetical protein